MKKHLLSLCLLLAVTFTAEAQMRPPRPHYPHHPKRTVVKPAPPRTPRPPYSPMGEFRFHVLADLGVGDFGAVFMHEIPFHFSVGGMAEYQIGHMTSIGLGAEYYSSYGKHCRLFENMQETYIHTVPVYANLKFTLPDAPISPFIEGRIGYSLPAGEVTCLNMNGVYQYISTGLYTGGGIGLKIYRTNLSCGVSVIDVVDKALGFNGGRVDVITDYYVRLSFAF
ncbi:MAG: hypothetical protein IJ057_04645 [Bacteroidales bacterium]|nr:hypothetical protein [Bacteroidales bacterium]